MPVKSKVTIDDNIRVTAISPQIVRVEPNSGPQGFEDRTTFMVVQRNVSNALHITSSTSSEGALLTTSAYTVLVRGLETPTCAAPRSATDVVAYVRPPSPCAAQTSSLTASPPPTAPCAAPRARATAPASRGSKNGVN